MDELEIVQFHQLQGLNFFVNTVSFRAPHFHHEWELLWVLDVPLKVIWQQKEYILQPGELALFPPKTPHALQQLQGICTFLCLQVSPTSLPILSNIITEDIRVKPYLSRQQYQAVLQQILDVSERYLYREPLYELLCCGNSALLLHTMLKNMPHRSVTPEDAANESAKNARLMRLTQYVEENYMHKITLADFARQENCSVSYLSHFIKNAMNQTFQEYVNSVRFSRACKLISEGNLSMVSVSIEAGFSDYRYFSRAFQDAYGMTPAEYSRKVNAAVIDKPSHIPSLHSQERFLTRGQSLAILQLFKNQLHCLA